MKTNVCVCVLGVWVWWFSFCHKIQLYYTLVLSMFLPCTLTQPPLTPIPLHCQQSSSLKPRTYTTPKFTWHWQLLHIHFQIYYVSKNSSFVNGDNMGHFSFQNRFGRLFSFLPKVSWNQRRVIEYHYVHLLLPFFRSTCYDFLFDCTREICTSVCLPASQPACLCMRCVYIWNKICHFPPLKWTR